MDFIIFTLLIGVSLPWIFIMYDIGCQWSKNFRTCMSNFPERMQINPATRVDVAIPSWHINGHRERCRRDFYLGYTRGGGRTCGEEVETTWASTNPLVPSVREMAPAARHKTLNDHWNGWNFCKIVGFCTFHSVISYFIMSLSLLY
jgi:Kyakuja-Dileera-Zisupton transposase